MTYVYLLIGFILLVKGADYFVEASSSVAKSLRIPSIIVGLTIVAFGTSAPELAVSTTAAIAGNNDIALGNVVGSNILNLLVVLGLCGVISPFAVKLRWDYFASVFVAVLLMVMMLLDFKLTAIEGGILLIFFFIFVGATIRDALVNRLENDEEYKTLNPILCLVYIVGGLAAIVFGGDLVVESASDIAIEFGLSESLVGLTIVAVGTSLPEIVTSVIAARKGENGLALGNVIGSNIFNILLVLATSIIVSPINVAMDNVFDIGFLVVASLITFVMCRSKEKISRVEGIVMLLMYVGYTIYIILR